ncbi:MAG TPA: hypothetical protein VHJ58_11545 [Vicinamibacterales bacterium]|nr:hypothetical protein [Vicinamibacterales bacterium]
MSLRQCVARVFRHYALFLKYNVSVVLTGHDHFYERVKPQKGIAYFVVGSGGQLRAGNIDRGRALPRGDSIPI